MTENEFASALRAMRRETEDEKAARLAPVATALADIHEHEFWTDTVWSHTSEVKS